MIPTLAGVILFVFFLFKWFGGDPAEILGGLLATPEQIQAFRTQLGLNKPIYQPTAAYGHFGRKSEGDLFPWERVDLVEDLKAALAA